MTTTEEIHLVRRPRGVPQPDDFAHVEASVGEPDEGDVVIESLWMSVDPYMRPRLDADQPLNAPLLGGGIGRIVESRHEKYREGDLVRHNAGFRKRFVSNGKGLSLVRADPKIPLSVYLHALGGTGLTAYGGLLEVGALKDGEQVFVSTAAGAVGSVAVQIAKLKGCYVVGSTGSDAKAQWLREELGLDAVINYRREEIGPRLADVTPQGIDVYFENVGGAHLDAALARMNVRGRIPVCGMISTYNGEGDGVRNLFSLIYGRIRMEGFVASDFAHLNAKFVEEMSDWVKAGRIKYQETVLDGFERAPEGLIGLFRGENTGKMLIRVSE